MISGTARTAAVVGKPIEAIRYAKLAAKTHKAFHKKYYNKQTGSYGQAGGNIFALKMGVPKNRYSRVVAALRADILASDGHLDTGIFGTQFFFETLSAHGMHDLAYEAMNKQTEPSYGYGLAQGATTTWEYWDGRGSQNHPMFGGGLVWFYRTLAGMQADPQQPGYRHIVFRPQPHDDLSHVTYTNNTAFGEAGITWRREGHDFIMDITVPVGNTATVHVPSGKATTLTESGRSLEQSPGVQLVAPGKGTVTLSVGSGKYRFRVDL